MFCKLSRNVYLIAQCLLTQVFSGRWVKWFVDDVANNYIASISEVGQIGPVRLPGWDSRVSRIPFGSVSQSV